MAESGEAQMPQVNQTPHIQKQPAFIRDFSKEQFPQERKAAAGEIRARRKEYFDNKKNAPAEQTEVRDNVQEAIQKKDEQYERLRNLQATITNVSDSWVSRTLRQSTLRQLKGNLQDSDVVYRQTLKDLTDLVKEDERITRELGREGVDAQLGEARGMLNKFYERQKEEWSKTPYDVAEMKSLLTPEHLASLSLPDYIALLKRFPSYMITHVTRQGVRDHTGHSGHTGGIWEYSDGFMKILQDGRLDSAVGTAFRDGMSKEAVAEFFGLDRFKTREEAMQAVENQLTNPLSGGYPDRRAVHFAAEWVADYYYGSETGNEIFFAFPSVAIGANFYSKGNLFHKNETNGGWDDTWIWNTNDTGIPVNMAIAFIPGEAQVDPKTGSKYELDENKKTVVNHARFNTLKSLMQKDNFVDALKEIGRINKDVRGQEKDLALKNLKEAMKANFGIEDDELLQALLFAEKSISSPDNLVWASRSEHADPELNPRWIQTFNETGGMDASIKNYLQNARLLFQLARNPISSKDFWENYFRENPSIKPNKIVYYGGDPARTFDFWRKRVGLTNFPELNHEEYARGSTNFSEETEALRRAALETVEMILPPMSPRDLALRL